MKIWLVGALAMVALIASGCGDDQLNVAADSGVGPDGIQSDGSPGDDGGTTRLPYAVVGTNQVGCYDSSGASVDCAGTGQDGEHRVNGPRYTDNGDGTATDEITGVIWQQTADSNGDGTVDANDKFTQAGAVSYCEGLELGGHSDWELPDIKTLYSLIDFSGEDVSGLTGSTEGLVPFINDAVFGYGYGDTSAGERIIDAQWATTSIAVSNSVMMFGVNFADGRIKGYGDPMGNMPNNKLFYVQCVRNKGAYGENVFADNGDGTITDKATGLMWQQADTGAAVSWDAALKSCGDATTGGHSDWRLPDAKGLQSIVDYSRSPDTSSSAAINPLFSTTSFTNEKGETDYGFYWTSTTHKNSTGINKAAVYISFGRALGYMQNQWMDVHGAGAQRSDPKDISTVQAGQGGYQSVAAHGGTALAHGPQGDVVRGLNYVRCVRNAS